MNDLQSFLQKYGNCTFSLFYLTRTGTIYMVEKLICEHTHCGLLLDGKNPCLFEAALFVLLIVRRFSISYLPSAWRRIVVVPYPLTF